MSFIASCFRIESVQLERFCDAANAVSTLDIDDQMDEVSDLALYRSVRKVDICSKRQGRKSGKRLERRICVHG
jgi:hypothetical protein